MRMCSGATCYAGTRYGRIIYRYASGSFTNSGKGGSHDETFRENWMSKGPVMSTPNSPQVPGRFPSIVQVPYVYIHVTTLLTRNDQPYSLPYRASK